MAETAFPAFLRAEYREDANGFPAFARAAETAAQGARRAFETNLSQIQQTITSALSVPRNAGGSLDLGVPQLQAAAQASEARAIAAREVASAVRAAALAEGDYSQEARQAVAAAEALAKQETAAASAARSLAAAHEQVQAELNKSKSATDAIVLSTGQGSAAYRAAGNSLGVMRQAGIQAGQQLQDIVISLQGGQRASTVFAQQLPQLAYVLSGVEGAAGSMAARIGGVARLLSGPWGAAILVGTLAAGSLASAMSGVDEAAKAATAGSSGLADAQSTLGAMFDLVSGKLEHQNALLVANARLQSSVLMAAASKSRSDADEALQNAGATTLNSAAILLSPIPGASRSVYEKSGVEQRALLYAVRSAKNDAERQKATEAAFRAAENMKNQGLGLTKEQFQQAVINYGQAEQQEDTAKRIARSLDTGHLDDGLKRDGRQRRQRKGRATPFGATEAGFSARIEGIVAPFDDAPRTVDRVTKATTDLDKVLYDIQQKKPPNMQGLIDQVKVAKVAVENGLTKPFADYIKHVTAAAQVDSLRAQGRDDEAVALQDVLRLQEQMGPLTEKQRDAVLATVIAERQRNAVIRDQRALIQANLDMVTDLRGNIEQTLNGALRGRVSIASFGERLMDSYANALSKSLTEKLFGASFRELEDQILGGNKVQTASDGISNSLISAGTKVADFGQIVGNAASAISAAVNGGILAAANDNPINGSEGASLAARLLSGAPINRDGSVNDPNDIVVTGQRSHGGLPGLGLTPTDVLSKLMTNGLKIAGLSADASAQFGKAVSKSIEGSAYGSAIGGLIGGGDGAKLGSAIGGILGVPEIGKELSGVVDKLGINLGSLSGVLDKVVPGLGYGKLGGDLSEALGIGKSGIASAVGGAIGTAVLGPLGGIVGGILGSFIDDIFSKTAVGSAVVRNGASPVISAQDGGAAPSAKAGGAVQDAITKIADQFGAQVGNYLVSIGVRGEYYRVSGSGDPNLGDHNTGNIRNLLYDGKDGQEAARIAILNALQDGAIKGIHQGAQRLLTAGSDLDTAVTKALKFESVFTRLKEATDPVGSALDKINKEFQGLKDIFAEAGSSASEYADLEKLYGIERTKAVKAATDQMTSAYKDLLTQLTTGDNGRSLRDRLAAASAIYDPLKADLAAGKTVDPSAYTSAASTLLDIQRQLYGSQSEFFASQDQIIATLQTAIGSAESAISSANDSSSPFAQSAPVIDALDQQTQALANVLNGQFAAVNDNLGQLIAQGFSGGRTGTYGGFGDNRNF